MKNVLITGTGGGLGKELAKHFAQNNWNVIATMIYLEEGKELQGIPNIKCYELDVTSSESIENAKAEILKEFKHIDVIINNAGVFAISVGFTFLTKHGNEVGEFTVIDDGRNSLRNRV